MTELIPLEEFKPVVSLDYPPDITPELLKCAAIELRRSPNFLSYLKKLHLQALVDLGTIKTASADESDVKATYARLRANVTSLEAILQIPDLASQHPED